MTIRTHASVAVVGLLLGAIGGCASTDTAKGSPPAGEKAMDLGNFSVSLTVKDLATSKAFYENLGFASIGGDGVRWVIMQNSTATIGLFQGMFEKNLLTFNPGWDRAGKPLAKFDDVRAIQRALAARGVAFTLKAAEDSTGPASVIVTDPDGNAILLDQHVPKPAK